MDDLLLNDWGGANENFAASAELQTIIQRKDKEVRKKSGVGVFGNDAAQV